MRGTSNSGSLWSRGRRRGGIGDRRVPQFVLATASTIASGRVDRSGITTAVDLQELGRAGELTSRDKRVRAGGEGDLGSSEDGFKRPKTGNLPAENGSHEGAYTTRSLQQSSKVKPSLESDAEDSNSSSSLSSSSTSSRRSCRSDASNRSDKSNRSEARKKEWEEDGSGRGLGVGDGEGASLGRSPGSPATETSVTEKWKQKRYGIGYELLSKMGYNTGPSVTNCNTRANPLKLEALAPGAGLGTRAPFEAQPSHPSKAHVSRDSRSRRERLARPPWQRRRERHAARTNLHISRSDLRSSRTGSSDASLFSSEDSGSEGSAESTDAETRESRRLAALRRSEHFKALRERAAQDANANANANANVEETWRPFESGTDSEEEGADERRQSERKKWVDRLIAADPEGSDEDVLLLRVNRSGVGEELTEHLQNLATVKELYRELVTRMTKWRSEGEESSSGTVREKAEREASNAIVNVAGHEVGGGCKERREGLVEGGKIEELNEGVKKETETAGPRSHQIQIVDDDDEDPFNSDSDVDHSMSVKVTADAKDQNLQEPREGSPHRTDLQEQSNEIQGSEEEKVDEAPRRIHFEEATDIVKRMADFFPKECQELQIVPLTALSEHLLIPIVKAEVKEALSGERARPEKLASRQSTSSFQSDSSVEELERRGPQGGNRTRNAKDTNFGRRAARLKCYLKNPSVAFWMENLSEEDARTFFYQCFHDALSDLFDLWEPERDLDPALAVLHDLGTGTAGKQLRRKAFGAIVWPRIRKIFQSITVSLGRPFVHEEASLATASWILPWAEFFTLSVLSDLRDLAAQFCAALLCRVPHIHFDSPLRGIDVLNDDDVNDGEVLENKRVVNRHVRKLLKAVAAWEGFLEEATIRRLLNEALWPTLVKVLATQRAALHPAVPSNFKLIWRQLSGYLGVDKSGTLDLDLSAENVHHGKVWKFDDSLVGRKGLANLLLSNYADKVTVWVRSRLVFSSGGPTESLASAEAAVAKDESENDSVAEVDGGDPLQRGSAGADAVSAATVRAGYEAWKDLAHSLAQEPLERWVDNQLLPALYTRLKHLKQLADARAESLLKADVEDVVNLATASESATSESDVAVLQKVDDSLDIDL